MAAAEVDSLKCPPPLTLHPLTLWANSPLTEPALSLALPMRTRRDRRRRCVAGWSTAMTEAMTPLGSPSLSAKELSDDMTKGGGEEAWLYMA